MTMGLISFLRNTLFCLCLCFIFIQAEPEIGLYPKKVEDILNMSGRNRFQLEKAIDYFRKKGDSLQLKAIYFLIENMDIHYSINYYWADEQNQKIEFDELSYPNFESAIEAFNKLKETRKLHPVLIKYYDIDTISSYYLINNVEQAFKVWQRPWAKNLSFSNFCEYILPYRISIEPLQLWRSDYKEKFGTSLDSIRNSDRISSSIALKQSFNKWFYGTEYSEIRRDPIPRLGPQQLLFRKQGACEDMADLCVYALRSQGLACGIDMTPAWATSSGRHFWNFTFNDSMHTIPFDITHPVFESYLLKREPSKVIRLTFAKQPNVLAFKIKENDIPPGFMLSKNYIDVTKEYWPVKDIKTTLLPLSNKMNVVYACVLNYGEWQPVWWGKVENNETVFLNMACGAIYMPMYYAKGKLEPAGYPIALRYDSSQIIKPEWSIKRTITIKEENNYLLYRPGKNYRLYYWNQEWIFLAEQKAEFNTKELVFKEVPSGALLRLIPEYSQQKERPFIINTDGKVVWW